jgi:PAS domain S-box-containing protein
VPCTPDIAVPDRPGVPAPETRPGDDLGQREERLRFALQASGTGWWDHDLLTGRVVWPEGTERLFGVPPGWFDGRYETFAGLLHPEDRPAVSAAVADSIARVGDYEVEFRAVAPDGGVRHIHARGHVIPDATGRPVRLVGVGWDVTRRRRAEEARLAAEERYRAFVANSSEGIWRFDLTPPIPVDLPAEEQVARLFRDGVLVECNDQAARVYGLDSADTLIGARVRDLLLEDDPVNREVLLRFVREGYAVRDVESRERGPDGRDLWLLNSYRGVIEGRALVRVWGTQRDVTAVKASENRYRRLIEHALAVFYETEPGAPERLAFVSPQVEALSGHGPEAFLADPGLWRGLVHPDDRSRVGAALGAAVAAREAFLAEYRIVAADGRVLWVRDEALWDGRRDVLQGFLVDVTDRRLAEEQVRESDERFRYAIEAAGLVVWDHDLVSGRTVRSENSARVLGVQNEGLDALLARVHPDDKEAFCRAVADPERGDGERSLEYRIVRDDGEIRWIADRGRFIPGRDGRPRRMLGVAVDVTQRRRFEEALARQARELTERSRDLERSNAELERFAYVASHDLQEPLRVVRTFAQLLAARYRGRLDPDADEFLDFVQSGARRMSDMIHDLLELSRVGSAPLVRREASLDDLVDRVVSDLSARIVAERAEITRDGLPRVLADARQVERLYANLIGNALKFRSDRPCLVHLGAERRDGTWVFSVEDNGIGVAPADRERIFDVFLRAHGSDRYPGTGIGLAICKRIVERHGGRIWAEPRPSGGTVFRFTLGETSPPESSSGG